MNLRKTLIVAALGFVVGCSDDTSGSPGSTNSMNVADASNATNGSSAMDASNAEDLGEPDCVDDDCTIGTRRCSLGAVVECQLDEMNACRMWKQVEDCVSTGAVCDEKTTACIAQPTCDDDTQNGDETDIDCGGSCDACEDGLACTESSDCVSGTCTNSLCAPTPECDGNVTRCAEGNIETCQDGAWTLQTTCATGCVEDPTAECLQDLSCSPFVSTTTRQVANDGVGSGQIAVFNPNLGEYLYAWAQRGASTTSTFRLELLRVTRDGQVVPNSRKYWVPTSTVSDALPRVVATDDGWAAVYRHDASPRQIQLARVDSNGDLMPGYPKRVDHGSGGASDQAALAYNPADGTMLVAWLAWEGDPNDADIRTYVAPISANGEVDHTKRTPLNTQLHDSVVFAKRGNHSLAFDGSRYAFVYTDFLQNTSQEVWVAFFGLDGTLLSKHELTAAEGSMTTIAAGDGDFGVSWRTDDHEIWLARLATDGTLGTPVQLSNSGLSYADQPSIVTDGADGFRVFWQERTSSSADSEIWMAHVDGNNVVTGPTALIQRAATSVWMPAATYDGCQTVVAVYEPFGQTSPFDIVWVP